MGDEQRIVHFSGTVQGVGFRYTVVRSAAGYDVTGYVKNLRDGRVECVVEGSSEQIDLFLAELQERMGGYIRSQTQQVAPCTGGYRTFGVEF